MGGVDIRGDGTTSPVTATTFRRIGEDHTWKKVSAGTSHAGAITTNGELFTWGSNSHGRLGISGISVGNIFTRTPTQVGTADNWVYYSARNDSSAAINSDGELFVWGRNNHGQLGDAGVPVGAAAYSPIPVQMGTADDWVRVRTGNHTLAFNTAQELFSWGQNTNGQLGLGDGTNRSVPYIVGHGATWGDFGHGLSHSLALVRDFQPGPATPANFDLTKHLQKPVGTPAPNLNFRFTFERNSFNDNTTPADINRIPVINPIILNPTTVVSPPPPPAGTVTLEAYFDFLDGIIFTEVGTYSWIIREDATHPAGQGSDSEVVFSQAEYELRVYVGREPGALGALYIRFITLHRLTDPVTGTPLDPPQKVNNLIFVNTYTYDPFITPTGLWMTGGSLYLVVFTTGVTLAAYLSLRARKRIEDLLIMH